MKHHYDKLLGGSECLVAKLNLLFKKKRCRSKKPDNPVYKPHLIRIITDVLCERFLDVFLGWHKADVKFEIF